MMEDVAAGAEELNASVREIADNMGRSRARADEAFERVVAAGSHVDQLNHTAESMTGIVRLIANISSQINLLALNATIEAARAGESGRGFAVVAHEVKTLAAQTKTATDEVAREIEGLRSVSAEVSQGLGGVRESIDTVREYVTTTAAAVEEQSAVATEMSVNMNAAAQQAAAA
jgi:methyl-accepting chemotaxis protein